MRLFSTQKEVFLREHFYDLAKPERSRLEDTQDARDYNDCSDNNWYFKSKRVLALICVADGASGAPRSGEWARFLTHSFTTTLCSFERLSDWYESTRSAFNGLSVPSRSKPKTWHDEAFEQLGPQSTIGGLIVFVDGTWEYYACGDTIFFYLPASRGVSIESAPINHHSDFPKAPQLLNSIAAFDREKVKVKNGSYKPGDRFLITTDCMARLLLRIRSKIGDESFGLALRSVLKIQNKYDQQDGLWNNIVKDHFDSVVRFFQQKNAIESDDITVVIADVVDGGQHDQ